MLDLEGWRVGMTHELRPESRPIPVLLDQYRRWRARGRPSLRAIRTWSGSSSATTSFLSIPAARTLPHHKEYRLGTVGLLDIERDRIHAEIQVLGETEGSPNPGTASTLDITREDGRVRVKP